MNFLNKLFMLLNIVVIASIVVPLLLGALLYLSKEAAGFGVVMLSASSIGILNLIALRILQRLILGKSK